MTRSTQGRPIVRHGCLRPWASFALIRLGFWFLTALDGSLVPGAGRQASRCSPPGGSFRASSSARSSTGTPTASCRVARWRVQERPRTAAAYMPGFPGARARGHLDTRSTLAAAVLDRLRGRDRRRRLHDQDRTRPGRGRCRLRHGDPARRLSRRALVFTAPYSEGLFLCGVRRIALLRDARPVTGLRGCSQVWPRSRRASPGSRSIPALVDARLAVGPHARPAVACAARRAATRGARRGRPRTTSIAGRRLAGIRPREGPVGTPRRRRSGRSRVGVDVREGRVPRGRQPLAGSGERRGDEHLRVQHHRLPASSSSRSRSPCGSSAASAPPGGSTRQD